MDWDNLGFGIMPADYMYTTKCSKDGSFEQGRLSRYGNVELSPSAGVLNYGQASSNPASAFDSISKLKLLMILKGLYEGTKAYRKEDGRLLLFRPDQNAIRMRMGADRLCMPCPSIDQFVDAVKGVALANKRWVPPPGKGTLYIRPLLMGSGPVLGLAPAPEYTFLVYASPVGNYFKEGLAPLSVYIEEEFHRASRGGAGGVKSITNYAPVRNVSNTTGCRLAKLCVGNVISTPAANGTILQGVTRRSVIEIARDHGYQVEERAIPVEELVDADEVFCTGTAVGVAPVGSITYQNRRVEYKIRAESVTQELYSTLEGIKMGLIEDKKAGSLRSNRASFHPQMH
ncbi:hypothetical protein GH714_004108 [Hevea brasiliensis]|uniref:Branched-chain-amino-acid aminotransferase n=1 Tax=Hevea brasiliensis TaxID=3981 RepID=A0A6A6NFM8_HEVBR|nr:hypothetical protein GH714_004108 [Hevea brasiliensis]